MEKEKEPVTQTEKEEEKNEEQVETQATEKKEEEKTEKTFTQDDLNAFEKKIKKQYKEKYKGYDEWLESQKTEADKKAEKEKEYQQKDERISRLEKENLLYKKGVKDEDDQDYIIYKVSKIEGDFKENLTQFLTDNPKYTQAQKKEITKIVDLGDEHKPTETMDLAKMSYEEYKKYRSKN